jgi:hypothetical protein
MAILVAYRGNPEQGQALALLNPAPVTVTIDSSVSTTPLQQASPLSIDPDFLLPALLAEKVLLPDVRLSPGDRQGF